MKVEMVVVVGSRGSMYRGEMREYTFHTSHIKCGMTAMVVVLSVTEFCKKMSVTYRYIHVNNHISTCITYISHTSHIKCGMAAQLFLSVTEFARRAWTSQVYVNFP